MKSTILLTIALFLISAPTPDSKTISEISAGFLVPSDSVGLLADQHEFGLEDSSNQTSKAEFQQDPDDTRITR